jgi:hypothetical protein
MASYGVTVSVALLSTVPLHAETVTTVRVGVNLVRAVKLADVDPAATVTLLGTLTRIGLLLDRRTNTPPAGAGPLSTTVPVEGVPPLTVLGTKVRETSAGGLTVRVAVTLLVA